MNNQSNVEIIGKIQDTFLYYDPVYGTKYKKINSSAFMASSSLAGAALGYTADRTIIGALVVPAVSAGLLWYINKDKSQKPIDSRQISLIKAELKLKVEHNLEAKKNSDIKIKEHKDKLKNLEKPLEEEKDANKKRAEENLTKRISEYEENFNKSIESLKTHLTMIGALNCYDGFCSKSESDTTQNKPMSNGSKRKSESDTTQNKPVSNRSKSESIADGAKLYFAFKNIVDKKYINPRDVDILVNSLPKKFKKDHSQIIRVKLTDIGRRPVLESIVGPIEKQYIKTERSLQYCRQSYAQASNTIEEIKKVYTLEIVNEKAKFSCDDLFKKQMPD